MFTDLMGWLVSSQDSSSKLKTAAKNVTCKACGVEC